MSHFTLSADPNPARMLSIWFGIFFEPFYSDREATRRGLAEVAALVYNTINLDSKAWEDYLHAPAAGGRVPLSRCRSS